MNTGMRGARAGMRGNQRQCGEPRFGETYDGADAQHEGEDQRGGAVGADLAVAHDVELALAAHACAEAVGRVGQPILMQRSR